MGEHQEHLENLGKLGPAKHAKTRENPWKSGPAAVKKNVVLFSDVRGVL
jgi:hypothetical protein